MYMNNAIAKADAGGAAVECTHHGTQPSLLSRFSQIPQMQLRRLSKRVRVTRVITVPGGYIIAGSELSAYPRTSEP